ncbi:MAG: hypothetical protein OXC60_03275 [Litoreibacter sp.]|nr:hypothetical protein [Litoreibacter sp.]
MRGGDVLIAQNGFLFLGNDHVQVIDKLTGQYLPSQEKIVDGVEMLARMETAARVQGGQFLFAMAPNKHSIHSEFLPEGHGTRLTAK